jgi:uncharacterized protein involved in exopolysaccharide biosynthesis
MRGPEPILLQPEDEGDDPRSDPVRTLVLPLWRARWLIAAMLVAGGTVGLFLGLMQPNTYRSSGKLMLRYGAREEATPETIVEGGRASVGQPRDIINTELHLLRAPIVYEDVARKLTPKVVFSAYDPFAADDENTPKHIQLFHRVQSWWFGSSANHISKATGHSLDECDRCIALAADALQERITLQGEYNSSVITVAYVAHDSVLAKQVVDAFLDAAENRHRSFYDTSVNLEVATESLKTAEEAMTAAETEFSLYRSVCGFMEYEKERNQLLDDRTKFQQKLQSQKSRLDQCVNTRDTVAQKLAKEPPKIEQEVLQPPATNPRVTALLDRKWEIENALAELDARIKGLAAETALERQSLEEKLSRVIAELESVPPLIEVPPVKQQVDNQYYISYRNSVDSLDQEIGELETDIAHLESQLEATDKRIEDANTCGTQYVTIEAKARKARADYETQEKNLQAAQGMHNLDKLELSNLRRIQDGTLTRVKEGPRRAKLLVVGLILGSLAGAALGFVRHLMDKRVHSPHDVERLLGLQVVGVLPRRPLPRTLRRAMRRAAL